MFKRSSDLDKGDSSSVFLILNNEQIKKLKNSKEYEFFRCIYENIPVNIFAPLYQNVPSRPNASIRAMISALMLKRHNNWTYDELLREIEFNVLTRSALGLFDLFTIPFSLATIFNFQNKIMDYYVETGKNLLLEVYDRLIDINKKRLSKDIRNSLLSCLLSYSDIIREYNLQLLVEIIRRVHTGLPEEDKQKYKGSFIKYLEKTASKFVTFLKPEDLYEELVGIKQMYSLINSELLDRIKDKDIKMNFMRAFDHHFTIENGEIAVKEYSLLNSAFSEASSISPRRKADSEREGSGPFSGLKKSPRRNRDSSRKRNIIKFNIGKNRSNNFEVSCPYQTAIAVPTKKGFKAVLEKEICETCKDKNQCRSVPTKKGRTIYFFNI